MFRLRLYSLEGWYRFLKLKLLGRDVIVRGYCRSCGRCCQGLCLDAGGEWIRTRRRFERLVRDYPEYGRFEVLDRNSSGYLEFACTWLEPDGSCRDYEQRLPICRNYPEDELYFTDGRFIPGCGYRFEEVPSFRRLLQSGK